MADNRIEPGTHIVFYDGVCGFCNAIVRFVAARDSAGSFRFASQQGAFAAAALRRWGRDPDGLETMYLLVDYDLPSEKLICNAAAILTVFRTLGGVWKLSAVAHILPLSWLDWIYSFVIRNRYRIFGRYDHCPIAPPHLRARFIDDDTSSPAARAS